MTQARVISVNVATVSRLPTPQGEVASGIRKRPASGRVPVGLLGLEGDEQADPTVHGGLKKAVYAYPAEHYGFWKTVRAQAKVAGWDAELPHGFLGENLTVEGLSEATLWVGDRLRLPDALLVVTEPRQPCFKFNAVMGFAQASRMMAQSGWCGAYLAVVETGTIGAGDAIEVIPGPREVGIRELFEVRMRRRSD